MEDRFGLPNFAYGIDGMHVRFEDVPRNLPLGHDPQQYHCRKLFYSINVQV